MLLHHTFRVEPNISSLSASYSTGVKLVLEPTAPRREGKCATDIDINRTRTLRLNVTAIIFLPVLDGADKQIAVYMYTYICI